MADTILVIHFSYALFIIAGFIFIWTGFLAGWESIRNPLFRYLHLSAMGIVVVESVFGIVCPLTWLENTIRNTSGPLYEEGFIPYWIHTLLLIYIGFFILMIVSFIVIPPRGVGK